MDEPTRRTIRQRVQTLFGDGVQGALTSVASATGMTDTARVETTDYWRGADLALYNTASALNEGIARRVSAQTSVGAFTVGAFPAAPTAADSYELSFLYTYAQYNNAISEAIRRARGLHWRPWQWDGLIPVAGTYEYDLPFRDDEGTITIDAGGTTTTLVDAALTQAVDYWNGGRIVGRGGTAGNLGATREVSDFSATLDTLTLAVALPSTPVAADTYHLIRFQPSHIYAVEYLPSGSTTPVAVPLRNFEPIWRAKPMIRFDAGSLPPVSSTVRIYGLREPEPPAHDLDPIEAPEDYVVNFAYWQLLRSRPRRPELKLNEDSKLKQEAWDTAWRALKKERLIRPPTAKRVVWG